MRGRVLRGIYCGSSVLSALALSACGQNASEDAAKATFAAMQPVPSASDVLGFEAVEGWSSAALLQSDERHTEGLSSLSVSGFSYAEVQSVPLSNIGLLGKEVSFDLLLPSEQPNPTWYGEVQLYAEAPSAGIYNTWIGHQSLTGLPLDTFIRIKVQLPDEFRTRLQSTPFHDLRFKITLNTPMNSAPYLLDRLTLSPSETEHAASCDGQQNCTIKMATLPQMNIEDVALSANEQLRIGGGAQVVATDEGNGAIAQLGHGATTIGETASVRDVWSRGSVVVRSAALVDGTLTTAAELVVEEGAVVTSHREKLPDLGPPSQSSIAISFPPSAPDIVIGQGEQRLTPGAHGAVRVTAGGRLLLVPGEYTFTSLHIEAGAEILLKNGGGPVQLSVASALAISGALLLEAPNRANTRIIYVGGGVLSFAEALRTTVIAPNADVVLGPLSGGEHVGAVFGNNVELHGKLVHRPFRTERCDVHGQCTPVVPAPAPGSGSVFEWKSAVPVNGLAAVVETIQATQASCDSAAAACSEARADCARPQHLTAGTAQARTCDEEPTLCALQDEICGPLQGGEAAPGYTPDTDPLIQFFASPELSTRIGFNPASDVLRFKSFNRTNGALTYEQAVKMTTPTGVKLVPVYGGIVAAQPTKSTAAIRSIVARVVSGFAKSSASTTDPEAAIGAALDYLRNLGIPIPSRLPKAAELALVALRLPTGEASSRDRFAYTVPFRLSGFEHVVAHQLFVDAESNVVLMSHPTSFHIDDRQIGSARFPSRDELEAIFEGILCMHDNGTGQDRYSLVRDFSTTWLPKDGNRTFGTVSCDEPPDVNGLSLAPFDIATFMPSATIPIQQDVPPIEELHKVVYTNPDNIFANTSAVETQYWGEKVVKFYRDESAKYLGRHDFDRRNGWSPNGGQERIRLLSVADIPVPEGKSLGWLPPPAGETSVVGSNGIVFLNATSPEKRMLSYSDPSVLAHEFFHSVVFDYTGAQVPTSPDFKAITEGLANCFEMVFLQAHRMFMRPDFAAIEPFHLKPGIFEENTKAELGQPNLENPRESARDPQLWWMGQRKVNADRHEESTLLGGVCKLLVTGDDVQSGEERARGNPVLGGQLNPPKSSDVAVLPMRNQDLDDVTLSGDHHGASVQVDAPTNYRRLTEILLATVHSGRLTPQTTFEDFIDIMASEAERNAVLARGAGRGWEDTPSGELPERIRTAFAAYGFGRRVESESNSAANVGLLGHIAARNLISVHSVNGQEIKGCACGDRGDDEDFFVFNERVEPGDTINFNVESEGRFYVRLYQNDPCDGFYELVCEPSGCAVGPGTKFPKTACQKKNQVYPGYGVKPDPIEPPRSGSVVYQGEIPAVFFVGLKKAKESASGEYKLRIKLNRVRSNVYEP